MINIDNVEIKKIVNRFTLLLEINALINSTLNLDELLRKILNVATIVVQAEASSLALIDTNTDELVYQFAQGGVGDKIETLRLPIGKGIAGWVAKYGVSLNIPDAQNDPRFWKGADDKTQFITKSVLCVPLRRNERIIGVLQALNKQDNDVFTEEDLVLFESLANIASIAIENSQLYLLLNQQVQKLEETNQRLEAVLKQLQNSEDEINKLREFINIKGTLKGKLDLFAPENIIQLLANDSKTGKLAFHNDDEGGFIYFDQGKVYHAQNYRRILEQNEDKLYKKVLSGDTAFYELIFMRDGLFSFIEDEITSVKTIQGSVIQFIIEGLKRLDEYNALIKKYPLTAKPSILQKDSLNFSELSEEKQTILNIISENNNSDIQTILFKSNIDKYSLLLNLDSLVQSNIIAIDI